MLLVLLPLASALKFDLHPVSHHEAAKVRALRAQLCRTRAIGGCYRDSGWV
jgi:hypothetical protein